ncbi:MAG: carboxypeptidase-like regulatory domain-containing protein [Sulfolobales archaeon]
MGLKLHQMITQYWLMFLILVVSAVANTTSAQEVYYITYSYELDLDMSIDYVLVLSNELIAVLGSVNDTSVIRIINVSETFSPKTLFTYPISGRITSYSVDEFPVRYLAIGTDLGETIVFSVERGRLYEKLHSVQGVDFFVDSVYLLKTPTTVKLAALSINKKLPSERYVYVFDINTRGFLRIGPTVGNLSNALENITPHLLVPLKVVRNGSYYYDASKVFITYTGLSATLNISATYIYNNTNYPASYAYVEIELYDVKTLSKVFSYDINLDENGLGTALVPLGYIAEVRLYDIYGNTYKRILNLSDIKGVRSISIDFQLMYRPDTKIATKAIPTLIKVFNFSRVPVEYEIVTDLELKNYVGTPFNIFSIPESGRNMYILTTEHNNYLNITYVYENFTSADVLLCDYLGFDGLKVKYVDVDVMGKYLIAALRDGRIKTYAYDGLTKLYRLEQEYIAIGEPLNTKLVHVDGKTYYLVYTSRGLQILLLEPLQLPLLRFNTSLTYNIPGARFADSSSDLSLIVIGGGSKLLIIRDFDKYLKTYGPLPLNIDSIRLPALTLRVVSPNYTGVPNARVVLTYGEMSREFICDENGVLELSSIFPGKYIISIYPQTPHLQPTNITVEVLREPHIKHTVMLNYTTYSLNIITSDEFGGGPQAPIDIYLNDKLVVNESVSERHLIEIPYGSYNITVKPSRNYAYLYKEASLQVSVEKDITLNIVLERKAYNVTLNIIDELTREIITDEVIVSISDIGLVETVRGSLSTLLKAGHQKIDILIPAQLSHKYLSVRKDINVMAGQTFSISVPRRSYNVEFKLLDPLTGEHTKGLYNVYANGMEVARSVGDIFNLSLPYGDYVISIYPLPPYNMMYMETNLSLVVDKDLVNTVNINRVKYSLLIRIIDPISRAPIVPLKIVINNTSVNIPAGTQSYSLSLHYGTYHVTVLPDLGFENVYEEYSTTVNLMTDHTIDVLLNRRKYNLTLNFYDVSAGPLLGLFDIFVNDTLIFSGASDKAYMTLPYDTYVIVVKPQPQFITLYSDYKVTVKLFNHTQMNIPLSRKYYTLTLLVRDDADNPALGALVTLIDTATGTTVARGVVGGDGKYSTSVYYGSFQLIVSYEGFSDFVKSIDLTTDITERIVLKPLPITLVIRNLPIIVIATLIIISMIVIVKLRGKIAERIYKSEEFEF